MRKVSVSRTPRVVKVMLFIFLGVGLIGGGIGVWWDLGNIEEKGFLQKLDPECLDYDEKVDAVQKSLDDGEISQEEAEYKFADLRERRGVDRTSGEGDCWRAGMVTIIVAFIPVSLILIFLLVRISKSRRGKSRYKPQPPKRRKKDDDSIIGSDDFDSPIFS
tara:strand:+ start:102 stop:587 length:486 start_codon:yes stop_codon:yes gene_type:complete